MKHDEAKKELKHIMRFQKTVRTTKLQKLLDKLYFSPDKDPRDQEIDYLKQELKKEQKYRRVLQMKLTKLGKKKDKQDP